MALPIPIVVENFGAYYMEQKKRAGISAKRQQLEAVRKAEAAAGEFEVEQLTRQLSKRTEPSKKTSVTQFEMEQMKGSRGSITEPEQETERIEI